MTLLESLQRHYGSESDDEIELAWRIEDDEGCYGALQWAWNAAIAAAASALDRTGHPSLAEDVRTLQEFP